MADDTLLVMGDEATVDDVETAIARDSTVDVRAVDDLDALFRALCDDVVSALLVPAEFGGVAGLDVVRGVRGLYPDLPILVTGDPSVGDGDDDESSGVVDADDRIDGDRNENSEFDDLDVATVETESWSDERIGENIEELLARNVDGPAGRPPSRLETLAMSMFDGFNDHLYAKDADARHVLTGSEAFELGRVIGRTDRVLADGVTENPRTTLLDDEYVVSSGNPVVDREEYVDGESEYTLTSKVPWYDADGSVVGLVGISRDISDRKRQERELRQQNERLAKIAIVAAHELRNELQVATGSLSHLRDDPSRADDVQESLDRLEAIVDDVVKLASAERRAVDEETEWLSTPVREVWQMLETADAALDVSTDRLLAADPQAVRLFFEILLSNAVEHGGRDVTVTVGATSDGFYVADDGAGIEYDPPERVFDAGFATTGDDAGFGLYVAQRIAADHGWTLGVGDGPDGGARFDVDGVGEP